MKRLVAVLAAISITFLIAEPAGASVYNGLVIFDCEGFQASGTGSHVLDRDNTGDGREALRIEVVDGNGSLIFEFNYDNFLGTYSGGIGDFSYDTSPVTNPLTFTLISLAGNGLPEQIDHVESGTCDEIPFAAPSLSGPSTAAAGDAVTVTGSGCPEGPVAARLATVPDGEIVATATGTADADGNFAVEIDVPADSPAGSYVIQVVCGSFEEPTSEPAVLNLEVTTPPSTDTTPSPTTTASPSATAAPSSQPVAPRFAG